MNKVNRVLYAVAEAVPFAKAGGVADVAGAMPSVLKKRGYDVRIFTPLHGVVDRSKFQLEKIITGLEEKVGRSTYKFDVFHTKSYDGVDVYLLHNHKLFGSRKKIYGYEDDNLRFYLFDKLALKFLSQIDWEPQVVHGNDWHCGLIPYFLNYDDEFSWLEETASVYTIHNLSYQHAGIHEHWVKYGEDDGISLVEPLLSSVRRLNFAKRAIINADAINAVSPQYADEILTEEMGMDLDDLLWKRKNRLTGILNGVDYFKFDPMTDEHVAVHYDENDLDKKYENKDFLQKYFKLSVKRDVPLLGVASRLVGHKGFDLMSNVLKILLKMPVQLVVVGSGEKQYVRLFEKLAKKYPRKLAAHLEFDVQIASWIYAGSDMFLMPSKFEPCGLAQLFALRYGSVPIVHSVGGLADTIMDFDIVTREGNGFVFDNYHELSFYGAIVRALEHYKNKDVWLPLVQKVMQERFSWEDSVDKYEKLYEKALRWKKQ